MGCNYLPLTSIPAPSTTMLLYSTKQRNTHTVRVSHYNDVIMGAMVPQITSLTIVYSTVYSGADQRKHQSSASLAFVMEIHREPVNFPHNWPVTRKIFAIDDVIMWIITVYPKFVYMFFSLSLGCVEQCWEQRRWLNTEHQSKCDDVTLTKTK